MDLQQYISSGILELYVSGQLSPEETQEVERMANQYAEVRQEIAEIELAIAQFATSTFAAPASDALLDRIMAEIQPDEAATPVVAPAAKIRSFDWRWVAVAAGIALLISLALNFYQFQQLDLAEQQIAQLENTQQGFAERLEAADRNLTIFTDPQNRFIALNGVGATPEAKAQVVWKAEAEQVYFQFSALPQPAANQQYQLWAIVDGKPVDAGVLEFDASVQLAKSIALTGTVSAFAVTLEPLGGSVSPTLEQMVLYGEVG